MEGIRTTPGKNTTCSHYFSTVSWLNSSQFVVWIWSICRVLICLLFFFFGQFCPVLLLFSGERVYQLLYYFGELGLIPELGRSPGKGNGNPLQYSCLENSMDRGAWRAAVHGVSKSWSWLCDFFFFNYFIAQNYPPSNTPLFSLFFYGKYFFPLNSLLM